MSKKPDAYTVYNLDVYTVYNIVLSIADAKKYDIDDVEMLLNDVFRRYKDETERRRKEKQR